MELMAALESSVRREQSQNSFLTFCSSVWPAFMEGGHTTVRWQKPLSVSLVASVRGL